MPRDEHFRAEEICGELPCRGTAVKCFIVIAAEMLAQRHGGVRALPERWPAKMGAIMNRPYAGGFPSIRVSRDQSLS